MPDYIYKIPNNNTSLADTSNPANLAGGAAIDSSTSNSTGGGLNEQQVRDIVNSMRSTYGITEDKVRAIVNSMQKFLTGQNIMMDGIQKSQNFLAGSSGWQIDAEGNAEFNNGTFRGTFNIGGTTITIDNTEDIQENLDTIDTAGGGTLFLQNGTYTLTADISIPSGVRIEGVSRDGVIIDCNTSYKIQIIGSNAYTTGTITIANGASTVVGSGTTFTAAMVGRHILLGEDGDYQWYEITTFTDTTHIDIADPYTGPSLSGDTYTIATINIASALAKVTIHNATGAGLKCQYGMEQIFDDVLVYDCGTGLDFDQVVYPQMYINLLGNGVNWDANEVSGFEVRFSSFDDATTGAGVLFNKVGTSTFFDSSIRGNTGDGINKTNCNFIAYVALDVSSNGGQGIELVSNCNDNQFIAVGCNDNTSDGYKFTATSDRNVISNCTVKDNGGYGINIAAATCDDNIISSPAFSNNSSGNINNLGTNTKITLDDSSAQTISGVKTFSADPLIPDEAYGSGWNGALEPPTKNAVYDKIETLGSGATGKAMIPKPGICDSVGPVNLAVNSNTLAKAGQVIVPAPITVNKISFYNVGTNVAGTIKIGIYSDDGQTKYFEVTTASIAAAGVIETAVSAVALSPGNYYVVLVGVSTVDVAPLAWDTSVGVTGESLLYGSIAGKNVLEGTFTVTAGTLPATFDPTALTSTADRTLFFRLDN